MHEFREGSRKSETVLKHYLSFMDKRNLDKSDSKDAITLNSILEPAKMKLESLAAEEKPTEESCLKILEKCLLNGSNVWNRDNTDSVNEIKMETDKPQSRKLKRKKENRRYGPE